ncbi:hypothetical protein [Desulfonema magnum]|uniref:DNA-binding protein n=1 Tax=Desulfonema magnum TaxID=45655 RepID=A0A975BQH5_9BACT|nr:hypothetical protein [Desulfonema magnum]QTA89781.1 Uncharacterized protein dnm_058380 [Desulfonema magnum]
MKYLKGIVIASLVLVMAMTGQALARGGHHGGYDTETYGQGSETNGGLGTVTDYAINIFEDAPGLTIAGTVSNVMYYGGGFEIDTEAGSVTVYGIGPFRYWSSLEIDRPVVGDEIVVDAYEVTFSDGSVKIIAAGVSVGGEYVELRDPETSLPLWRKGFGRHGGGQGIGKGQGFKNDGVCPRGQTFPAIQNAPATENEE